MAGLGGDNVGILLRIKADSADAIKDLNKVQSEIKGVGTAGTTAAGGLGAMVNPATLAAAGIAAVGAAVAAAAVGIFNLTKATADFGSALFDAQAKTGLSAETLSTLKLNADKAGSSFEQVTATVSKFTVLLGQAQQGNEKAQATLAKYGITATDTATALDQAITTIAAMETVEKRAAAARELFKDKTLAMLPIIEQLNGKLSEATKETIRTGQAMTDKGIKAADDFGDALVDLQAQAAAVGRQFATELMPAFTRYFQQLAAWLVANQDTFRAWGTEVVNIMRGVEVYANAMGQGVARALAAISSAFGSNKAAAQSWGQTIVREFMSIIAHGGLLLYLLGKLGAANPAAATAQEGMGGGPAMPKMPSISPGGGGGGGGGGKDPKDEAEKRRKEAVDAARKEMEDTLAVYAAGYKEREALLAAALSRGEILEIEKIRDTARVRREALMDETRLNEKLLANPKINLNEEERAEILQKLKILTIEIRTETLRGGTEINAQVTKEIEANDRKIEQLKEEIELERKRANERGKRQAQANADAANEALQAKKERAAGATLGGGGFAGGIAGAIGIMGDASLNARDKAAAAANGISASWGMMKDSIMGGVDAMVQGLGSMVEAWVLYGSAGPQAMKKMVASVLAGVAAQSAVLAIFELAKGFASLWLNPKEAADHFIAAALFGSIATGAALGGRAVAGDSFQNSTANGGAGGGASDGPTDANTGQNTFTTRFGGFGSTQSQGGGLGSRLTGAIVQLEETTMQLATKIKSLSPGSVLAMGADENPRAIRGAIESELSNDAGTTGAFVRGLGFAT